MKKSILFLICIFSFASASFMSNMGENNNNNQGIIDKSLFGKYIPNLELPDSVYVQRKRFEINTYNLRKIYEKYFKIIYDRKKILTNTFNMFILKKPVNKILKAISHIYVNPVYIQQIILPKNCVITNAVTSTPFSLFTYQKNELDFKAKNNFEFGNIVIHYTNHKQNYTMNILVDNYLQKECFLLNKKYFCKTPKRNKFDFAYSNFALIYQYKNIKPLNSLVVITLYQKLTGKKITNIKNGSFISFEYKGLTYFIYRNDKFGNIILNNKKFFVKP